MPSALRTIFGDNFEVPNHEITLKYVYTSSDGILNFQQDFSYKTFTAQKNETSLVLSVDDDEKTEVSFMFEGPVPESINSIIFISGGQNEVGAKMIVDTNITVYFNLYTGFMYTPKEAVEFDKVTFTKVAQDGQYGGKKKGWKSTPAGRFHTLVMKEYRSGKVKNLKEAMISAKKQWK